MTITYKETLKTLSKLGNELKTLSQQGKDITTKRKSLCSKTSHAMFTFCLQDGLTMEASLKLHNQMREDIGKEIFKSLNGSCTNARAVSDWLVKGHTVKCNDKTFTLSDFNLDSLSQLPEGFIISTAYKNMTIEKKVLTELKKTNTELQADAVARGLKESPRNGVDSLNAQAVLTPMEYAILTERGTELLAIDKTAEQEANDNEAFGNQLNDVLAFLQNNADKDDLNAFQEAIDIRRAELI